mmetsp:Transcript_33751/g.73873  ORF Transcript_33751/g.73873 Transcript_33751/m.73873 type:complete len:461 (+) Transcript_33751:81-1463(+)|eukprot:CAMPEP_0170620590 /NCGR_PEP_ID=MMETSP0224-20130122/28139_1 /TAXON_ID=285029 /ORGANISM="Togula jolla, Strain CCCM 725" /LENGTH=460 /DNA_ID=CAMNT_0010946773 /DNA_START=76 /DNA_END=1458 /DNA_ORIENTATION=-
MKAVVLALLSAVPATVASSSSILSQKAKTRQASSKGSQGDAPVVKCSWAPAAECTVNFSYEGQEYTGCANTLTSGIAWCSHSTTYTGEWSHCSYQCEQDPHPDVAFPSDYVPSLQEVNMLADKARNAAPAAASLAARQAALENELMEVRSKMNQVPNPEQATQAAAAAAEIYDKEQRRVVALPTMAKMVQEQAVLEHLQRLEAEKRLEEVRKNRSETQNISSAILDLRKAVALNRLEDRVRAAEDARIAKVALVAAQEAIAKVAQIKAADARVQAAIEKARGDIEAAKAQAVAAISASNATLNAQVAAQVAAAWASAEGIEKSQQELVELLSQVNRSAGAARLARQQAFLDRARADAVLASATSAEQYTGTLTSEAAKAQSMAEAAQALYDKQVQAVNTNVQAVKQAEADAYQGNLEGVTALKDTAQHAAEIYAKTEMGEKFAEVAPGSFMNGFTQTYAA